MTATSYPIQSYILDIPLDVNLLNSRFTDVFEKSLLNGFYYSFSGKVLILGNANVGKTCITRILIGKKPKKKRESTEGIQVHVNRACIDRKTNELIPGGKSRNKQSESESFDRVVRVITVFTVFRLLTDFVCLFTFEF